MHDRKKQFWGKIAAAGFATGALGWLFVFKGEPIKPFVWWMSIGGTLVAALSFWRFWLLSK